MFVRANESKEKRDSGSHEENRQSGEKTTEMANKGRATVITVYKKCQLKKEFH